MVKRRGDGTANKVVVSNPRKSTNSDLTKRQMGRIVEGGKKEKDAITGVVYVGLSIRQLQKRSKGRRVFLVVLESASLRRSNCINFKLGQTLREDIPSSHGLSRSARRVVEPKGGEPSPPCEEERGGRGLLDGGNSYLNRRSPEGSNGVRGGGFQEGQGG